MEVPMEIHRYSTTSPADAFDAASKDASHWTFNEMLALKQMAERLRNGYSLRAQRSTRKSCICEAGFFLPRGRFASGLRNRLR